jgi:hypothetical protein
MNIRLPNTDEYVEMEIDMTKFVKEFDTDTEIFGWYEGNYIAIKK